MVLSASLDEQVTAILAQLDGFNDEPPSAVVGRVSRGLKAVIDEYGDEGINLILSRESEIRAGLDRARVGLAGVTARLAAACMLLYSPADEQPAANAGLSRGGPAADIALAALHLIRHADAVVPLDVGEGPLEEATDPDFSDYRRVFGSAVDLLATASYYLLDPSDSRAALLSSPPEQEAFPPLPFPRVWVEMTHLTPMLRLLAPPEKQGDWNERLDLLGVGIAEVEQGRVWDIYLPFQFDGQPEFFFLAGRIAPDRVVAIDPALSEESHEELGSATFRAIRELAVGAVHLITARNAPPGRVPMPRHQRRRLEREQPRAAGVSQRLYYVDLHAAGDEHQASGGGESGREYHVRWLVRGHWRHVDHGRSFCTCCDPARIATWVAPYIKGPAGAPWKGKQVHR